MSQQAMEQERLLEFQSGWISLIWIMLTSLVMKMITRTGEHLFYKEFYLESLLAVQSLKCFISRLINLLRDIAINSSFNILTYQSIIYK